MSVSLEVSLSLVPREPFNQDTVDLAPGVKERAGFLVSRSLTLLLADFVFVCDCLVGLAVASATAEQEILGSIFE